MVQDYLAGLPMEVVSRLALDRVVGTKEAAMLCNISVVHLRRLVKQNKVPAPVRLSERKMGWRLGTLNEFIAQRGG
ncbi:hypothetical protein [Methylobacterium sp. WL9]|uniref:helix-turn-helix transcriptional regulator n=1 Tax=Methylobacterium sp. WL9 TaxID=2603898 RepID=UPI0016507F6F|nr:hypothetical protein [Methylobacterium sp. WL9]